MKGKITFRQVALIVFTVIVATAVAHYDELLPHRWQTYTAPDGTFSIELPGKPTVETIQVPADDGGTMPIAMISARPTAHTYYGFNYFEKESIGRKSPDEALVSARDGSLRKIQGTVLTEKRLEIEGHPALDTQASARGDSLYDSRLIIAGNRLYMISAVATVKDKREAKTVQRVMNSFKILRK